MKRWRKVEVGQTILATIIIASIVGGAIFYGLPSLFWRNSPEAVKIVLVVIPSINQMTVNQPERIRVYAANDAGQIDPSRNDIIELTLDPPNSGVTLSISRVTLVNGEAIFSIIGTKSESITLKATWIEGKTPLKSTVITLKFLQIE